VDWIYLTQIKVQWQATVNVILNLHMTLQHGVRQSCDNINFVSGFFDYLKY